MNGLSLRVSSVKGTDTIKRNNDCKQAPIKLETIENGVPSKDEYLSKFIFSFSSSESVEEQLKLIKDVASIKLEYEAKQELVGFFAEIYFYAPLKHPVKNTLSKLIDKDADWFPHTTNYLSNLIEKSLSSIGTCQQPSEFNDLVAKIGTLLDNFKCGTFAFKSKVTNILNVFGTVLTTYLSSLGLQYNSPAFNNELCAYVHNLLRIVICAMQLFNEKIPFKEKYVLEFNDDCWKIISSIDIPVDTKANAGLLLATISKGQKQNLLQSDLHESWDSTTTVCVTSGVISVLDKNYIEESPEILRQLNTTFGPLLKSNIWEPCMISCLCRIVLQFSKKLIQLQPALKEPHLSITHEISMTCLDYAIANLDHYMDTVRHMSKDIIKNIITFGQKMDGKIITHILDKINEDALSKQNKSVVISCVCLVYGGRYVSENILDVKNFLLDSMENNNSHNTNTLIVNCFEILMYSRFSDLSLEQFFTEFLKALLDKLQKTPQDHMELRKTVTSLIQKALKKVPKIIDLIQKQNIPMNLRLACLSTAKKSGVFDGIASTEEKWKVVISFQDIHKAMISNDDDTRLSALELIVETHKTTELFTAKEMECILYFLKYNVNSQDPSIRQRIISQIRNICIRLKGNIHCLLKHPDDPNIQHYRNFIEDIISFCFENFFDGANFGRRTVSLKILWYFCDLLETCPNFEIRFWTTERYNILLSCIEDTFESNKVDGLCVLKYCPKTFKGNEALCKKIDLEMIIDLANSTKPASSLTAAYYLEYLLFINESITENFATLKIETKDPTLQTLCWLESCLDESLTVAKASLLIAASKQPLYGFLFCIRHILSKVNLNEVEDVLGWKQFIGRLIPLCKELADVVAPIVNSSSPEGHLPNDFSNVENFLYDSDVENLKKVTPQMVLLCAWRTIKEISLILGDISCKAPIIKETSSKGLITVDKLLGVGSHFTHLLSETKHRGAFEQAYVGFSRLCLRLWSSDETELHTLPMRWLQALVLIISGININEKPIGLDMNVSKLCSTRRSAGVPFLMQALITTELQIGTCKGLKFCMENLIKLSRMSKNVQSRTHALNILRSLFRCTDLGEAIAEFVSDGFMCAITRYNAETWGERNSATLLFSALMIRVFGVQRTRNSENLNIRNKMTGRIFFLRYPKLYDFFYNELLEAQNITMKGMRSHKLHPLLILLGRLYPSSLEGVESNLQLSKFVPLVSRCCASPELKTRQLAARIIPIFLQPDEIVSRIRHILNIIKGDIENVGKNFIHGALLQVLSLVKVLLNLDVAKEKSLAYQFELQELRETLETISQENRLPKISIIQSTICDILIELHLKIQSTEHSKVSFVVLPMNSANDLGSNIFYKKMAVHTFLTAVHSKSHHTYMDPFLAKPLNEYEFHESVINLLLLVFDYERMVNMSDDFEISDTEITAIRQLSIKQKEEIMENVISSKDFIKGLIKIIDGNFIYFCTAKALTLLSYSPKFVEQYVVSIESKLRIKMLIELAESKHGHIRDAVYDCLQTYLHNFNYEMEELDSLQFLKGISTAENSDNLRSTTVRILSSLSRLIVSDQTKTKSAVSELSHYFWCLFTLLEDDDFLIRNEAAKVSMKIYNRLFGCNEEENILPLSACELLYNALDHLLIKRFDDLSNITEVMDGIKALDQEYFDQITDNDESRCFDKNEGNIFRENFFIRYKRIQTLK